MQITEYTTPGGRPDNQDFIAWERVGEADGIFVVADGMGGYDRGAEAARVCAEAVAEYMVAHWAEGTVDGDMAAVLRDAFAYADDSLMLRRMALRVKAMGCCIVAAVVCAAHVHWLWLGDARGYLFRQGKEVYRTTDHSVADQLAQISALRPEDIEPYSHIVTRCMAGDGSLGPLGVVTVARQTGDVLMLCTDGMHKAFEPAKYVDSPETLVSEAQGRSSSLDDNLSFLHIRI